MSKLLALTKVLIKTSLFSGFNSNKKGKGIGLVGIIIILLLLSATVTIPLVIGVSEILKMTPELGGILLSLVIPFAGITTVVFSIFSISSVFYLSKDSEQLLPMPIKSNDLLMSKFIVSLLSEYYILFLFVLPFLIGIGVGTNAGVNYYLLATIGFLLLPLIPSVIVAIIIMFITRFIGITKNKDVFMYISMAIVLVFSLGYSFFMQNTLNADPNGIYSSISDLESALTPYFRMAFPFYNSYTASLKNYNNLNGFFSFIAFVAFNLISLIVLYFLGDKMYLRTLTVVKGNKKGKDDIESIVSKESKSQSSFLWLIKKEWLIVKRTPIFMLNVVVIIFLMPIILLFSFAMSFFGTGGDASSIFSSINANDYIYSPFAYLIIVGIAIFFTCSSTAAATSVSREGKSAWLMKMIPISAFKQVLAKVVFAVILDVVGIVFVIIAPAIYFKVSVSYVLAVLIPTTIVSFILNYLNILLDLKRPKINWDDESVAVKQNINTLFSMLISVAISVIFTFIAGLAYIMEIEASIYLLSIVLSIINGAILLLIIWLFKKKENNILNNID